MKFSRASFIVAVIACALCTQHAVAQPSIAVGTHQLLADTPGQTITLSVSGGQAVEALNFNAQLGDGGAVGGGVDAGPAFTGLDILTGTIFETNNFGAFSTGLHPQLAFASTLTFSGTVPADGLLATLTIDTTGVFGGAYDLRLSDTLNGPTDFGTVTPTITDGSIVVLPEPASLALIAAGALCAAVFTGRRRRGNGS